MNGQDRQLLMFKTADKGFKAEKIGNAQLILGDAMDFMANLPDKCIDAVVTSPPFRIEDLIGRGDYRDRDYDYYLALTKYLVEIERVTIDTALIFNSSVNLPSLAYRFYGNRSPEDNNGLNLKRILIWDKFRGMEPFRYEPILAFQFSTARYNLNSSVFTDCYHCPSVPKQDMIHDYQNPIRIQERWLLKILQHRNAKKFTKVVYDPFMGSGSILTAGLSFPGIRTIGTEIDPMSFEGAKMSAALKKHSLRTAPRAI